MNKSLYRIVFNKSRGQLMAVAETAGAQGKTASGETNSSSSFPSRGKAGMGARPILSTFSLCLALTFGVFVAAPLHVQAQIKADATAPQNQQPVILQTASGVPQVNISAPSAQGVSRNTYSQFDVNRQGVILNNARANVLTQLSGYVPGNPNMAAGSARVILNEINSANPSYINGYIEVAGQRAEVVIANPSGININGGGFINASRGTFTTGTPIMNGGSLDGYLV
jgi:filamentous hemagglutinin